MNLTFDVKKIGIVMPINNLLTFDVMSDVKFSADIRKEFGRWMQNQREERGLSQKFVAGKIGITETQLSRIENGKSGTERDTVIFWAQAVGIDENDALRQYKPENGTNSDSHDILDGVQLIFHGGSKGLSKKKQQEILDAARIVARGVMASVDADKSESDV